ncbi:right-handed parallel beta-helix repeat-containing protein, partial [Synergistaceae bacterium OttesenSCG-928-I11]|nr:right-handed parallel beta-helix repeat-containing protein [Synergistaceae bacterium OttesenSCG-928-I11]
MKKFLLAALLVLAFHLPCAAATDITSWQDLRNAITGNSTDITLSRDLVVVAGDTAIDLTNVTIKGEGKKISGKAPFFAVANGATFDNITFEPTSGTDPAINVTGGAALFKSGTKFTGGKVTAVTTAGTTTFDGVTFSGADTTASPSPLVSVTGGKTTFKGTPDKNIFSSNKATAVSVSGSGEAEFDGTKFSGNTSADQVILVNGGKVTIKNGAEFTNNTMNTAVINVTGSEVTIEDTKMEDNPSRALKISNSNAKVTCKNVTFTNNTKGAVDISAGTLTFEGGEQKFTDNKVIGDDGGALKITGGTVKFDATAYTFTGNEADNGGAIYTRQALAAGDLAKMTFTGNKATVDGGAIHTTQALTVSSGSFTKNEAIQDGGAIYATASVTVSGGTFGGTGNANKAGRNGGAIHAAGVTISGGTISHNEAAVSGGGVYSSGASKATITGGTFSENAAKGPTYNTDGGGAVYSGGEAEVKEVVFEKNEAVANGGALFTVAEATFTNCTFKANKAGEAGGALNPRGELIVKDCSFTDNIATKRGGGAIFLPIADSSIGTSVFKNNKAGTNGGALYRDGNSNEYNIARSYFEGNMVDNGRGGAADVSGASLVFSQCTFYKNQAKGTAQGGALASSATTYRIVNCTFVENIAVNGEGGGLFLSGGNNGSHMFYCTFADNQAENGGGVCVTTGGTLSTEASVFVANKATAGADTYRGGGTIFSRGYNVIGGHGAFTGGQPADKVNWKTDVNGSYADDKYDPTYQRSLIFGATTKLDGNSSGLLAGLPYDVGSTLGDRSVITTLK